MKNAVGQSKNSNAGLKVKSQVKAGGMSFQHNRSLAPKVKSQVKAGGINFQHNRTLVIASF